MIPSEPIFHKPQKFIAAKNLLYASLFLSAIVFVIHNINLRIKSNYLIVGWILTPIVYVALILIIKQMALCKKWPRTVLTVLYCLGFVSAIASFFNPRFSLTIIEAVAWALRIILEGVALIFLYSRDCENWFNSKKYDMFQH